MIWRWLHRHPWLVDLSIVGLLLVAGTGAAVEHGHHQTAAVVLSVAEVAPLLLRRLYPVAVVVAVTAASLAMIADGVWLVPLPLAVALYTLTSLHERRADR